ncbi:MAG: HAD-IA family hydrolase [Candidatus Altiarchaeales archaeon]|nr:HAD-IA family hydrolase [Candidatus Altiarchaeales archaeon]MBD3416172.1 HAD-IA family hydrolase [Candidatus Altiarchaeales archaeon]
MSSAFIFDMDGTLVDSFEAHFRAWEDMFRDKIGASVTRDEFRGLFGMSMEEIFKDFLRHRGMEYEGDLTPLVEYKQRLFRERHLPMTKVLPGAVVLLEGLEKAGVRAAVASNTTRENIEATLESAGLNSYFDAVVGLDDVERGKPDPGMFLKAASLLDAEPGECIVVEDSVHGLKAAKSAGMTAYAVLTGCSSAEELREAGADKVFETLDRIALD